MLDAVTKGFRAAKHKLTGKAELSEANIDDALRDIRVALLEADVEFNVAKRFLARVKEKALGEVVATTSPSAFSFTRARNRLATLNSTSASSSATRMSRRASSMFASVSSALPVSLCLAARNPLVTASSMGRGT